jgi:CheY-like chemotaxis protein
MYTILVADDEPVMLSMVEKLLRKEGHDVIKTSSARGVLNALEVRTPDLFLLRHQPTGSKWTDAL